MYYFFYTAPFEGNGVFMHLTYTLTNLRNKKEITILLELSLHKKLFFLYLPFFSITPIMNYLNPSSFANNALLVDNEMILY
jgi:hypothetical protein